MNNAFINAIVSSFSTTVSSSVFKTCLLLSFSFYSFSLVFRVVKLLCMPPRRCKIKKDVIAQETDNQTSETYSDAGTTVPFTPVSKIGSTVSGRGVIQGFYCDLPKPCKVHRSCSDCLIFHEGVSCYGITE